MVDLARNSRIPIRHTVDSATDERRSWAYLHQLAEGGLFFAYHDLESDGIYHLPDACLKLKEQLRVQTRIPNADGSYDYRVILNVDDVINESWARLLIKIGTAVAERLDYDLSTKHIASIFPAGYVVVKHFYSRGHVERSDLYVHGHPSKLHYKSLDDFVKHYLYLYFDYKTGPTGNDAQPCECSLCSPRRRNVAHNTTATKTKSNFKNESKSNSKSNSNSDTKSKAVAKSGSKDKGKSKSKNEGKSKSKSKSKSA